MTTPQKITIEPDFMMGLEYGFSFSYSQVPMLIFWGVELLVA